MIRKTISMPDEMGDWISSRIRHGLYNNESEYFRYLVRQDREDLTRLAHLRDRLKSGEEQLANGSCTEFGSDAEIDALFASILEDE